MAKSKKRRNAKRNENENIVCGTLVIGEDGEGHIEWEEHVESWIRMTDEQVVRVGADLARDWIRELEPMVRRDADRLISQVRTALSVMLSIGPESQ